MSARVIVVEKCEDCPHRDHGLWRDYCCVANMELIPNPSTIPSFCPLPKKEGGE